MNVEYMDVTDWRSDLPLSKCSSDLDGRPCCVCYQPKSPANFWTPIDLHHRAYDDEAKLYTEGSWMNTDTEGSWMNTDINIMSLDLTFCHRLIQGNTEANRRLGPCTLIWRIPQRQVHWDDIGSGPIHPTSNANHRYQPTSHHTWWIGGYSHQWVGPVPECHPSAPAFGVFFRSRCMAIVSYLPQCCLGSNGGKMREAKNSHNAYICVHPRSLNVEFGFVGSEIGRTSRLTACATWPAIEIWRTLGWW